MEIDNERYQRMLNGGRDSFTIKEIIVEFMKEQRKFNEHLSDCLTEINKEVTGNTNSIKYMKIGLGLIFTILSYLVFV